MYQYLVGFAYLAIGLFVYFRRGSAQKAAAFLRALSGFVRLSLLPLHGKLNGFDKIIYYGNLAPAWLAPALFPALSA